ncbi:hypothetical protein HHL21_00165 [Massilia sp. RP-1-19]|uniref:Uncharacterized protein n=1 Tax=Massilia polaris TaxID=2728846 RepID=A0A848HH60_9BURK|nr:TorF family putative porin [Massilia polaris]NML59530.1 hypothetical protein [Massilia polaris]
MKKLILASAVLASVAAGPAFAGEATPDHPTSFNVGAASDYRYRGISQTRLQPALQGGIDYTHAPSGFYAGAWASTIKWTSDAGGDGDIEIDLYAGKRGVLAKGVAYDVGVLTYVYPSNGLAGVPGFDSANTTEIYGQLGLGPAYVKYSYGVSKLFGFVDSKNSGYVDIGANLEAAPGTVVNLHLGRQTVKNTSAASYTDWKLGVTRDFGFATGALALIGTNASRTAYASPANGKFLGKNALVLTLGKTF